jgi:hypothetical protein
MTAKVFETAAQKWSAQMAKTTERRTKALVVEVLNTLFNKRDCKTAERSWYRTTFNTASQLTDSCTYRIAGVCAEGG